MTSSLPGHRQPPTSRYNLDTYWGRVRHSMDIADPRTLFVSSSGLENSRNLVSQYKRGKIEHMNPELWESKKIIDATLHPDTGEPVFLPFRMSCFVISNLVVTAGMLTPGLGTTGTLAWQITNQSLNVGINYSNANKTSPLSTNTLLASYASAVTASCGVALGLNAIVPRLRRASPALRTTLSRLIPFAAVATAGVVNVFLMRGEEIRAGIDVFPVAGSGASGPVLTDPDKAPTSSRAPTSASPTPPAEEGTDVTSPASLGKSRRAATLAVSETALSRVLNATPIMVVPPLVLVRLQRAAWLAGRPRLVLPVNLGLILVTSVFALPLALAVFPQRQRIEVERLEPEFVEKVGRGGVVEFNRGI